MDVCVCVCVCVYVCACVCACVCVCVCLYILAKLVLELKILSPPKAESTSSRQLSFSSTVKQDCHRAKEGECVREPQSRHPHQTKRHEFEHAFERTYQLCFFQVHARRHEFQHAFELNRFGLKSVLMRDRSGIGWGLISD